MYHDELETPVGTILIEADDKHLLAVLFPSQSERVTNEGLRPNKLTEQCKVQLGEYFAGKRTSFDLPIRFQGTAFQNEVWQALMDIPFGKTSTYGKQAERIGNPKAVRAVGAANGKNKISIIVPCHRIIGANGTLTGYGGGIDRKRWLLEHERNHSGTKELF